MNEIYIVLFIYNTYSMLIRHNLGLGLEYLVVVVVDPHLPDILGGVSPCYEVAEISVL